MRKDMGRNHTNEKSSVKRKRKEEEREKKEDSNGIFQSLFNFQKMPC